MIIYSGIKSGFIDDLDNGVLEEKIDSAMEQRFGRHAPESEIRSWRNSLSYMGGILGTSSLPDDAGIAIEYNIPYTSKRVDLIVSGYNADGANAAVIIELKQWERAVAVPGKDAVVKTYINGGEHEVTHPSYQACLMLLLSVISTLTFRTWMSVCSPVHVCTIISNQNRNLFSIRCTDTMLKRHRFSLKKTVKN